MIPACAQPENRLKQLARRLTRVPEGLLVTLLCIGIAALLVDQAAAHLKWHSMPPVIRLREGETATLRGSFLSPWEDRVVVRNVVVGCSCSRATLEPMTIDPGSRVVGTASFDGTGKPPGGYDVVLGVTDAEGVHRDVPLRFRVEVLPGDRRR